MEKKMKKRTIIRTCRSRNFFVVAFVLVLGFQFLANIHESFLFVHSQHGSKSSGMDKKARRLAPQECSILIYTEIGKEPTSMTDNSGTCPSLGAPRAFLLDVQANGSGRPTLKETSPTKNIDFHCRNDKNCQLVFTGYGLQATDSFVLLPKDATCPPENLQDLIVWRAHRDIKSSSASVFSHDAKPQREETNMPVFDLGTVKTGIQTVCYSSSLALKGEEPQARDFHYQAGNLIVDENDLFSCDFEQDTCGLAIFKNHFFMDLVWQRNSGETETPGTGPSFDHTLGETGDGHYMYMDSPGYVPGAAATLLGQPQIFAAGIYCTRFFYHMSGDDINSMRMYIHELKNDKSITGEWGSPKWLVVSDQGKDWREGGFDFESDGQTALQLVVEALAGFSEKGDIAIDDIKITSGRCPDDIKRNTFNDNFICGEVRLNTGDWSEDKSWFVEGAVSCSGRGYSYDQLKGNWVPCCVPTYGNYTVTLKDTAGDGWNGSQLQFRFFDRVINFGEDFTKEFGTEKKYSLVVGILQITRVEGKEESIALEVQVMQPQAHVWCGAAVSGIPPPSVELLKKYGIRSKYSTQVAGDKVRLIIANKDSDNRMLKPQTKYDVYCYSESAAENLATEVGGSSNLKMDDSQVAASRVTVTTDSKAPEINIENIKAQLTEINVMFTVNEISTIWCLAVDQDSDTKVPTATEIKKKGGKVSIHGGMLGYSQNLQITKLMPDTNYHIYCYSEDNALPHPNGSSKADIEKSMKESVTESKKPSLKIQSYKNFSKGFRVSVKVDTPGTLWCGAAMAGSAYPSRDDVRRVGATANVTNIEIPAELEIRGVPPNTRYTIYCFAASRHGKSEMTDSEMWETAMEVTSFGKFCEMPNEPKEIEDGKATPFDPITPTEEFLARDFMMNRRDLKLDGIYRINLLTNKTEIINYLDNNGPMPKRYARVRVGTCDFGRGYYKQYKVGPLDSGSQRDMSYELITEPIQTECGGYTPQGVFGRRLLDLGHDEELSEMLQESFGYAFGHKKCEDLDKKNCLMFGPVVYEKPKNDFDARVWAGLKTPENEHVPFYFIFKAPNVNISDITDSNVDKLLNHHFQEVEGFWYDNQEFATLEELLDAYKSNKLKKVTPETLVSRRMKAEEEREFERRRLAPSNLPGPNPEGRSGLEYRAAPEHIEPQGKRFTIKAAPGAESYVISYAGWEVTVNNDRDTSLRLWNVKFNGNRIVFEMGVMEALAHYTVAERFWYFMDTWYGGLGAAARKLHPGVECARTGVTIFWDDSLCVFEQDLGRPIRSHWKSGQLRDGAPHMALVLRQMLTVSNYDYVTDYYFHLNGAFEGTMSFTGELYAGVEVPWFSTRQGSFGTQVTGSMRMGALHTHQAIWKIDIDVNNHLDNSVHWKEVVTDPVRPGAHKLVDWFAEKEGDALLKFNGTRNLHYHVVDENHHVYGNVGGWQIRPRDTVPILMPQFELYSGPAAWTKYRILTSIRKDGELDASLPRDNKYATRPAVCVDRYVEDNEPARHKDVVSWVSSGIWHVPVIEDMPLTVAIGNTLGWLVKPSNFFTEDPSMDLHNSVAGDVQDPGTCALMRNELKSYA